MKANMFYKRNVQTCGKLRRHKVVDLRSDPEQMRWDPKDGELCRSRAKPEETLVEARSGADVQIARPTWV